MAGSFGLLRSKYFRFCTTGSLWKFTVTTAVYPALNGQIVDLCHRYADAGARDHHFGLPTSLETLKWIGEETEFDGAVELNHYLAFDESSNFARADLAGQQDVYAVYTEYEYPENAESAVSQWKAAAGARNEKESDTLLHWVLKNPTDEKRMGTVEIYKNKEAQKEAIATEGQTGAKVIQRVPLKFGAGYLLHP